MHKHGQLTVRLIVAEEVIEGWPPLQELRGSPGLVALAFRELGKPFHTVANFFARQAQLIQLLQIEPKFRTSAEPVAEPQRRIGRDRALTVDDPSDSVHW